MTNIYFLPLTIEVSTGAGLIYVSPLVIIASHKQTHTIGPLAVTLGTNLHFIAKISDEPGNDILLRKKTFKVEV